MTQILLNKRVILTALVVSALVGMFGYITILRLKIDSLTTEHKYLTYNLRDCQSNNTHLIEKLSDQNKEIDRYKAASEERLKRNENELQKARKEAEYYRGRAGGIISRLPPSDDLCKSANDLINEEIANRDK